MRTTMRKFFDTAFYPGAMVGAFAIGLAVALFTGTAAPPGGGTGGTTTYNITQTSQWTTLGDGGVRFSGAASVDTLTVAPSDGGTTAFSFVGRPYAELYVTDDAVGSMTLASASTYYQFDSMLVGEETGGLFANAIADDATYGDHIVIDSAGAGIYRLDANVGIRRTAGCTGSGCELDLAVFINGVEFRRCENHTSLNATDNLRMNIAFSCNINATSSPTRLDLRIKSSGTSTGVDIEHANLYVERQ